MLNISPLNRNIYAPDNKDSLKIHKSDCLREDVFSKNTNNVSFQGLIKDFFTKQQTFIPPVEVMEGVDREYADAVINQINKFPQRWLKQFKDCGYKIIIAKSLTEAYKSQGIYDRDVELIEKQNPKGTLGVTYSEGFGGKNFFVFCDKPPYSNKYLKNIINHELSHGVVNAMGLDESSVVISKIKKDLESFVDEDKLQKLSKDEQKILQFYFFGNNARLPIDEIIADTFAWNMGGGSYGSGLVLNVKNENLMKYIFPNLSDYLTQI